MATSTIDRALDGVVRWRQVIKLAAIPVGIALAFALPGLKSWWWRQRSACARLVPAAVIGRAAGGTWSVTSVHESGSGCSATFTRHDASRSRVDVSIDAYHRAETWLAPEPGGFRPTVTALPALGDAWRVDAAYGGASSLIVQRPRGAARWKFERGGSIALVAAELQSKLADLDAYFER